MDFADARHDVSCASAHFCVATGGSTAYRFVNGQWQVDSLGSTHHKVLRGVSCVSETLCVTVEYANGFAFQYDGARWISQGRVDRRGQPSSVSCPTNTFCMAVDRAGWVFSYDGQTWSPPVRIDRRGLGLVSVS